MKPVIVVTRDPDSSNEISLYGVEAQVVSIDLGSAFDGTPESAEQALEWAEGLMGEIEELPKDHPARIEIVDTIWSVCDRLLSDEVDRKVVTLGDQLDVLLK